MFCKHYLICSQKYIYAAILIKKNIIPLYPRAISVILGDKWKKMKNEERRMYTMEAKALAEEQKRLNPDCWKRKRTNSVKFRFHIDNSYSVYKVSIYLSINLGFESLNHNGKWPVQISALS